MNDSWRDTLQASLGSAYHIRQELGGGGMSATFIAEETALGRSVVLKLLTRDLATGLSAERFQREIHLAARLQHAFIVPLLSAGVSDGQPWYTMPLVQGESLRARIAREGALTPAATARILHDVAEALAYAHAQGVVHRDIKPDNILLSGAHALVTDFGVAKAISASTSQADVTRTGLAIGTPAYMAPEQAAGDKESDHRADIYALGATAYEMLTGRMLFGDRSPARMLIAHATENPEPVAKAAPATPPDLAALVQQCLAKHPDDRPARAQDVADALATMLTRWTSGELPPAGRVTAMQALSLWAAAFVGVAGAAWLGVRWLPIPEWTFPAAALLMLAGLPVVLITIWLHRPARPIAAVPTVANSSTVGRIEAIARPHFTWRRAVRGGYLAVGVLALLAATWAGTRALGVGPAASLRSRGTIGENDRVLVADFDSPPSDTGLGAVVSDLLRTSLARSASIHQLTSTQRGYALMALGLPAASRVGSDRARAVAQRGNVKVFLTGGVTQLGSQYLVRSRIVETSSGNELASFTESAQSADDLIRAVDHMGRDVRDKIGASIREVRADPPLYFAVTPSLEAARLYTQGTDLVSAGNYVDGMPLLERAVQVDTEFADAYRRLASYYVNVGNRDRAAWSAERAFRYRNKLPPVMQRIVEGTNYNSPTEYDRDKSIAAYRASIDEFGPNGLSLNNLAIEYRDGRQWEPAIRLLRQAVRTDTLTAFAPHSLAATLWQAGRTEEARRYIDTLARWQAGNPSMNVVLARLQLAELRPDSAVRLLDAALRDSAKSAGVRGNLALIRWNALRSQGRSMQSSSQYRAYPLPAMLDTAGGVPGSVIMRAEVMAWDHARPADALRLLDSVTTAHPPGNASALAYDWLDVATAYAFAGDAAHARALLATYEQRATDPEKRYDQQDWQLARGWTAIADKRYADAIRAFRAADVGVCTTCALAPLGLAYDLAGQPDSAIAALERYLTTPDWVRARPDGQYLAATYKRLGELYEAKGNTEKARDYYQRFVDLWKNADPDLQPRVTEVRRRLARLSRSG